MSRDARTYLDDIVTCAERIRRYVAGLDRDSFGAHGLIVDAVVRTLEIIGEAAKHIADDVRN